MRLACEFIDYLRTARKRVIMRQMQHIFLSLVHIRLLGLLRSEKIAKEACAGSCVPIWAPFSLELRAHARNI